MACQRTELQKKVKELRKANRVCCRCTAYLINGLMLGGEGPTFSELVREGGMTWERIEKEVAERGLMCRKCVTSITMGEVSGARGRAIQGTGRAAETGWNGNPRLFEPEDEKDYTTLFRISKHEQIYDWLVQTHGEVGGPEDQFQWTLIEIGYFLPPDENGNVKLNPDYVPGNVKPVCCVLRNRRE